MMTALTPLSSPPESNYVLAALCRDRHTQTSPTVTPQRSNRHSTGELSVCDAVARGINRGLNYTTRWPRQTQMIRQKHWWDTGDATVDGGTRPPEAGAQVRILPGAPRLTGRYHCEWASFALGCAGAVLMLYSAALR